MSIDALVFCDCLERGAVRRSPPAEWRVHITPDGCRECGSTDPRAQASFGLWHETACGHDYGILAHRRLTGPEAASDLTDWLRQAGSGQNRQLVRILNGGASLEGHLPPEDVARLRDEVKALRKGHPLAPSGANALLAGLEELAEEALRVGKPLVF